MKLILTTPYNSGMNDPGKTYPELYVTTMTDNRLAGNFTFIFEAGSFQDVTEKSFDADGNVIDVTRSVWVKGPGMLSQTATVSGDDYQDAITSPPLEPTDTAYESIIRLLYMKLVKAGFSGTVVET